MSKLTEEILSQGHELIRDRIGIILADEIANQVTLSGNAEINAKVFSERYYPVSKEEVPIINILLDRVNYVNNTSIQSEGNYTFSIDAYTSAKSTVTEKGDSKSNIRMQKILGIVRSILESPFYLTLDFPKGFIGGTKVPSIEILDPVKNQDTATIVMGRLTFEVRADESVEQQKAVTAEGYDTQVKIEDTDKGFVYIIDN